MDDDDDSCKIEKCPICWQIRSNTIADPHWYDQQIKEWKSKYEEVKEMLLSVLREVDSRKSFDYPSSIDSLDYNIQEFWEQQKEKKDVV